MNVDGAGKSTEIERMQERNPSIVTADDFLANSVTGKCADAVRLHEILQSLAQGLDCVISDIEFCTVETLEEAKTTIRCCLPAARIHLCYFENDPEQCERNVRFANRHDTELRVQQIWLKTTTYRIPEGADRVNVWRDENASRGATMF